MNLDKFLEGLSRHFKNEEEALFRLDSIAFLASEAGLPENYVPAQAHFAGVVALQYVAQVDALKVVERVYSLALKAPNSALSHYIDSCRTQLQINVDEARNPMRKLAKLNHSGKSVEALETELKALLFGQDTHQGAR